MPGAQYDNWLGGPITARFKDEIDGGARVIRPVLDQYGRTDQVFGDRCHQVDRRSRHLRGCVAGTRNDIAEQEIPVIPCNHLTLDVDGRAEQPVIQRVRVFEASHDPPGGGLRWCQRGIACDRSVPRNQLVTCPLPDFEDLETERARDRADEQGHTMRVLRRPWAEGGRTGGSDLGSSVLRFRGR